MNNTKAYDCANENKIRNLLKKKAKEVKIRVVPEVGSTNEEMKELARKGAGEISVLVAESQTGGKGRKGRSFYSPANSGCYMSLLLRPKYSAEECTLLTTMAATVAAEAIEKVTGRKTQIKWVNDVFMNGRKVAGVLTEGSVSSDRNGLDWAVVGIGINICPPGQGFPDELNDIAGTILPDSNAFIKNQLIAEIINSFVENYDNLAKKEFMEHYRKRLFFLGKDVTVIEGEASYKAKAVDVDSMGHLIVITEDGSEKVLYGGEISIKP